MFRFQVSGSQGKLYLGNLNINTAVNCKFLKAHNIKCMISLDKGKEEDRMDFAKTYDINLYNRYFEDNERFNNAQIAQNIAI